MIRMRLATALALAIAMVQNAGAAEVRVLTAGAFKQALLAMVPDFEKESGHKVVVNNDTVGALTKRIEAGEGFDLAVLTPGAIDELVKKDKMAAGTQVQLARVPIGVVVKNGTKLP